MNRCFLSLLFLSFLLPLPAQKKILDHTVYDTWKSFGAISVTDDGKYAVCVVKEQEGRDQIIIRQLSSTKELVIRGGYQFSITPDQKYVVALIGRYYVERSNDRTAPAERASEGNLPKDTLAIISLDRFFVTRIAHVSGFKMGKDFSEYITFGSKTNDNEPFLVVYKLAGGEKDTIWHFVDYQFSKNGKALAIATASNKKDSTDFAKLWYIDLDKKYEKRVVSQNKAPYKGIALSESGRKLAFLAASDLYYYTFGADSATLLADKTKEGVPEQWGIAENQVPEFSKDEKRLFLKIAPIKKPNERSIPDSEKIQLDVWHWQDPYIQPRQLVNALYTQAKTYLSYIELDSPNRLHQLETEVIPNVSVPDNKNGRYALGYSGLNYRIQSDWDPYAGITYDLWILDLAGHTQKQIKTGLVGECHLSPFGNFLLCFDNNNGHYWGYSMATGKEVCLTANIPVDFWDRQFDYATKPGSYGTASWNEDETILVYDEFDIWKLDPSGVKAPENITKGVGREKNIRLRYLRTDPESQYIKPKEKLLLSVFDLTTKESGFCELDKSALKWLIIDKYIYSVPLQVKNRGVYLYTKSNFHTSPDLYVTDNGWKTETKLSDINPQMKEYKWGRAELVSWTTFDGKISEGILYKPEDFDPTKKYPMIVYHYQRLSGQLFRYYPPEPSSSSIIFPYYCSRGYIVFLPDVHYTTGYPGQSAYNYIVSGVEALCRNTWIDRERIGIQGHSWGGYQTAYLITRTNIFAAAVAAAGMTNLFSAYGGIRWGTGMSSQYLFEQWQGRIGKTIWEAPELYWDNSPIFFADKIETPVLMMHNDNDWAVPWYQSIEFFMALRRLQKPVWMLQYNGDNHYLFQRKNSKDLTIRYQQFFDHYLKGEPMPVWMKTGIPAVEKGVNMGLGYERD